MKKTILLVVMLTLAAFVSGAIAAAPPKAATTAPAPAAPAAPVKMEKFSGEVKSMDAMAKSIVVAKAKVEKSFMVTADTKIMKGKEALKFEDLKAGMNVSVEYKKDMDKMVAVAIKVSVPKAAPKK
jgi:Skp family chaperone for outer membrane proteins